MKNVDEKESKNESLTEKEKAEKILLESIRELPTKHITSNQQLQEWLSED